MSFCSPSFAKEAAVKLFMLFRTRPKVFVFPEPIDMRSGFEKLSFYIRERHRMKIDEGNLFLFLGQNRRRLKILYFDGSGLILLTKRMEKGAFMNVLEFKVRREITLRDLKLILHGSIIREYQVGVQKSS